MRTPFILLALGLCVVYVLMASNAVEFDNKTLEKTELVERVASVPTFHADRLVSYFHDRWEALTGLSGKSVDP